MSRLFLRLVPILTLALGLAIPAAAADLTYSVSGIHVDASGPSASAAESIAIDQGRPRAWDILYRRIAKQADWGKQPKLDAAALRRLSRGYTVANERRSTTRYVADVTYIFSPEAVARVMTGVSPSYKLSGPARRILLVPMAPNFDPKSPWVSAFSSPRFGASAVPFSVPTGTAPDVLALGDLKFDEASWADVQLVAARIHASEVVFALAVPLTQGGTAIDKPMTGKIQIWLRRIGIAETPTKTSVEVPLIKNPAQTYPLAADAAVRALEVMFQQKPAIDFGPKASLAADVEIASLGQWAQIQNAMSLSPSVLGVQVSAIDIGHARVIVNYQGPVDTLQSALLPLGVQLTQVGDSWIIGYAPPAKPLPLPGQP